MRKLLILLSISIIFAACQPKEKAMETNAKNDIVSYISKSTIDKVTADILKKFGEGQKFRIERGVSQAAALWKENDGQPADFEKFCLESFINSEGRLDTVFEKLQRNFEVLWGNMNKISLDLKSPLHLAGSELLAIDEIFGAYEPSAHLNEDFFTNKIAFQIVLNFPFYTLKEKTELGSNWTRKQWAYSRMGDLFTSRVPAGLIQNAASAATNAETYIAQYNIIMGNLVNDKNETLFPKGMNLISHWGIRDELKANYSGDKGLEKQKLIYEVMKRIINQDIPKEVINNETYQWNPVTNKVYKEGKEIAATSEPDTRYEFLLNNFKALKKIDAFSPNYPDYKKRNFELSMEIPQEDVEKLFISLISSKQVHKVAELISKRVKRKLEPFDIWYDGFKARTGLSQEELDKQTKTKYPNRETFEKDLPTILTKLGFKKEKAEYITSKVQVDAARGSGHAWGAQMRTDKAHLRTRIAKTGMDYKGYNIAIHEFGHNVEQTLSLYDMDYYMLNGVPNTSFTETLAFIFQKRDLEILGKKDSDANKEHLMALDIFWGAYEIMGVSLVDMEVWKWLYAHPDATPAQLKEAVITIAKDVWNKYYADIFGVKDQPILAIYSHMIELPLYLSAYPIGHVIEFQIEKQIKGKNFADEVMRIWGAGRLVPQLWMKQAVGKEISIDPMLEAIDEALKVINN